MRRLDKSTWREALLAHAAGAGLRELARKLGIPENTLLSRARREKWAEQIEAAKALVPTTTPTASPLEAVGSLMAERRESFQLGISQAVAKAATAAAELAPAEALGQSRRINDLVTAGCRLHGIGSGDTTTVAVSVLNQW